VPTRSAQPPASCGWWRVTKPPQLRLQLTARLTSRTALEPAFRRSCGQALLQPEPGPSGDRSVARRPTACPQAQPACLAKAGSPRSKTLVTPGE